MPDFHDMAQCPKCGTYTLHVEWSEENSEWRCRSCIQAAKPLTSKPPALTTKLPALTIKLPERGSINDMEI